MLLKIKKVKTEEETVELKLPAYFKNDYYTVMISEESVMEVTHRDTTGHLVMRTKNNNSSFNSKVSEYIQEQSITATEFDFAFEKAIKSFNEAIPKPV